MRHVAGGTSLAAMGERGAAALQWCSVSARSLFEDRYVVVLFDEARRLVRYVRTREAFPTLDAMRASNDGVAAALAWTPPRKTLLLLLDLREAPPRNDDGFEKVASRSLNGFVPSFKAHAVLMRTAVGSLQARRMARTSGGEQLSVFTVEADALAHLGVADPAK
jgi:hypothetical protein